MKWEFPNYTRVIFKSTFFFLLIYNFIVPFKFFLVLYIFVYYNSIILQFEKMYLQMIILHNFTFKIFKLCIIFFKYVSSPMITNLLIIICDFERSLITIFSVSTFFWYSFQWKKPMLLFTKAGLVHIILSWTLYLVYRVLDLVSWVLCLLSQVIDLISRTLKCST